MIPGPERFLSQGLRFQPDLLYSNFDELLSEIYSVLFEELSLQSWGFVFPSFSWQAPRLRSLAYTCRDQSARAPACPAQAQATDCVLLGHLSPGADVPSQPRCLSALKVSLATRRHSYLRGGAEAPGRDRRPESCRRPGRTPRLTSGQDSTPPSTGHAEKGVNVFLPKSDQELIKCNVRFEAGGNFP